MNLIWPLKGIGTVPGIYVTQLFGMNPQDYPGYKGHMGIDIGCPTGTKVYAAHDGNLSWAEEPTGYGHHIYISARDNSYRTIYGHLDKYVGIPRNVKQGDVIAYSNNSGNSTGPHLHFGLQPLPLNYNNGYAGCIDPMRYLERKIMSNTQFVHKTGTQEYAFVLPALSEDALKDKALNLGLDILKPDGTIDYSKAKDVSY